MAITDTTQLTLLVETAYDREVSLALRSYPMFRQAVVTKKPADLAMPGDVVTFTIDTDISDSITALTEGTDPTPTTVPAPTRVSVTLNEYGMSTLHTLKLRELSFAAVDRGIANKIAYNMASSIDTLVQTVMRGGTNVAREAGGNLSTSAAITTITNTDTIKSRDVRYIVAQLRGANVMPQGSNRTFPAYIHPDVSADLQAETGSGGWVSPHEYVDTTNIYMGEIGSYLGASFIETPRCYVAADGATGANVYRTYFVGSEALCEAVAVEPSVVVGPQTDSLRRNFPLGWYGLLDWAVFRQEALWRLETGSAVGAIA